MLCEYNELCNDYVISNVLANVFQAPCENSFILIGNYAYDMKPFNIFPKFVLCEDVVLQ